MARTAELRFAAPASFRIIAQYNMYIGLFRLCELARDTEPGALTPAPAPVPGGRL